MDFVHLHLHSEYSLLQSVCKLNHLFHSLILQNMKSVAITDDHNLFGAVEFYKMAKQYAIKPIIGMTARIRYTEGENKVILLIKDEKGYRNLVQMIEKGYRHCDSLPYLLEEELFEHHEGLICINIAKSSYLSHLIINNPSSACDIINKYIRAFGKENFYYEVNDFSIPDIRKLNVALLRLRADEVHGLGDLNLVATNAVHFLREADYENYKKLRCISKGCKLEELNSDDEDMMPQTAYLKSAQQMQESFSYIPEVIENTVKIADLCHFEFDFQARHLPGFFSEEYGISKYDTDEEKKFTLLKKLCYDFLPHRYKTPNQAILDRLEMELHTISHMGYVDYFLIVWDFVKYAKENGIRVGPGRGSGGASIVAYLLQITDIDPMKYQLIFERFLNPQRVSMPDFDIDFQDNRRHEVIEYVIGKYSHKNVANIVTFGRFKPKMAIRDIGRVMGLSYQKVDKIAKLIPFRLNITADQALEEVSALRNLYESDVQVREILDTAKAFENMPRHVSTHAAGVVITQEPLSSQLPLYFYGESVSTQYSMTILEELGFLKMDFLGLANLTIIDDAIRLVREHEGVQIDLNRISTDDKKVYENISTGENFGVFQLESDGMREFMKKLRPEHIEDIIAGISLYRPGPMDSIPKYIKNRHHPDAITYLHPKLRPILQVTYGCIVYQEQVMEIVRQLAGYDYGRSDEIRRAMSKKKLDVMMREREIFIHGLSDEFGNVLIEGCVRNGVDEISANQIFDEMIDFAKYAFNKAHAVGYAMIAYQTAYLKTYYPIYFFTALLNANISSSAKLERYISYAYKFGFQILKPDVNRSSIYFSVEDNAIRMGLLAVKHVGHAFAHKLLEHRGGGDFSGMDYASFLKCLGSDLNRRAIESLILVGALDFFSHNRRTMLENYDKLICGMYLSANKNQLSIFEEPMTDIDLVLYEEYSAQEMRKSEEELLGFSLSRIYQKYAKLYIRVAVFDAHHKKFLSDLLSRHAGNQQVVIYDEKNNTKIVYAKGVKIDSELLFFLNKKYGEDNIIVK